MVIYELLNKRVPTSQSLDSSGSSTNIGIWRKFQSVQQTIYCNYAQLFLLFTTSRGQRRWANNLETRWSRPRRDYLLCGTKNIKPQFTTSRGQRRQWGQLRIWLYRSCSRGAECLVDTLKERWSHPGTDRLYPDMSYKSN